MSGHFTKTFFNLLLPQAWLLTSHCGVISALSTSLAGSRDQQSTVSYWMTALTDNMALISPETSGLRSIVSTQNNTTVLPRENYVLIRQWQVLVKKSRWCLIPSMTVPWWSAPSTYSWRDLGQLADILWHTMHKTAITLHFKDTFILHEFNSEATDTTINVEHHFPVRRTHTLVKSKPHLAATTQRMIVAVRAWEERATHWSVSKMCPSMKYRWSNTLVLSLHKDVNQ